MQDGAQDGAQVQAGIQPPSPGLGALCSRGPSRHPHGSAPAANTFSFLLQRLEVQRWTEGETKNTALYVRQLKLEQ